MKHSFTWPFVKLSYRVQMFAFESPPIPFIVKQTADQHFKWQFLDHKGLNFSFQFNFFHHSLFNLHT
jgi:hypothetical protein